MSGLWSYLFDNDLKQRFDINASQQEAALAQEEATRAHERLRRAEERADRLELVLEALITGIEQKKILDRQELTLLIQRLDLADGVEDGRIGPDRTRDAPTCDDCGRPVNPRRSACLYCGAARKPTAARKAATARKPPPTRTVTCRSCARETPESRVYFSEMGMICESCYSGR